jgi:hypothetical protein
MGFIHDTKSEIFGIETRNESAVLFDTDENNQHLFINYVWKSQVRGEIAETLLKQAGEFYGKGEFKKADQYRELSDIVKHTAVSPDSEPRSFEATYQWLREMATFLNENDILPKD